MYDTMLMAKRVDPTKSASLDACVSRYLPEFSGFKMATAGTIKQAWKVPTRDLLQRNAMDAKLTYQLWVKLREILLSRGVTDETLLEDAQLAMVAQRIEDRGFYVAPEAMLRLKEQQTNLRDAAQASLRDLTGDPNFNPGSPKQVQAWMCREFNLNAQDAKNLSSNWETLQYIRLSDPKCRAAKFAELIIQYRGADKLVGNYIHGYAQHIGGDGMIHSDQRWPGTVTWRFSYSQPNLQNIPRQGVVRSMFTGYDGLWMWEADYSQFELRAQAALSRDPVLVEAFRMNQDLHRDMAIRLGWPLPTKEQRSIGKVVNFGTGYGAGAKQLRNTIMEGDLLVSLEDAARYIETFWKAYARLNTWRQEVMSAARSGQRITGPIGQYSWTLDDMLVSSPGDVEGGLRSIYNAPIQSPSTRYTLKAAARLERGGAPASLQVHDSLLGYAPKGSMVGSK